jgi:hypothetical protein
VTKIPTQVQTAWVGGTTHPLSTPLVRRASLSLWGNAVAAKQARDRSLEFLKRHLGK